MPILTLVRHGQASFLAENYDKLSPLGERQSSLLGEYWAGSGQVFDRVYWGPAQRHIHTGRLVAEAYSSAGKHFPPHLDLPEVDEYPGIEVMRTFLPQLLDTHEDIREMETQFRRESDRVQAARIYDRLFQRITRLWVNEELHSPEVERWAAFCERVERGIGRVLAETGTKERVVVFTSGGVIAAVVRMALGLNPEKTLELSWTSRNASYSDFLFSRERFSLSSFNSIPHLMDPSTHSYR